MANKKNSKNKEIQYFESSGPLFGVIPGKNFIKFSLQRSFLPDINDPENPRFIGWETNHSLTLLRDYLVHAEGIITIKTPNNIKLTTFDSRPVFTLTNHTTIWFNKNLIFNPLEQQPDVELLQINSINNHQLEKNILSAEIESKEYELQLLKRKLSQLN